MFLRTLCLLVLIFGTRVSAQTLNWERKVDFAQPKNTFGRTTTIDSAGNVYLGGVYDGDSNGDSTGIYLNKYSSDGILLWSQRVRTNTMYIGGGSVFLDKAEHPWLVCYSPSPQQHIGTTTYNASGTFFVHFSPSGEVINIKKVGYAQPGPLSQDADGNIYLGGYGKMDTSGKVLKAIGGFDIGGDDSGNIYRILHGNYTTLLTKIDPAGVQQWTLEVSFQTRIAVSRTGHVFAISPGFDGNYNLTNYDTDGFVTWEQSWHDATISDVYVDDSEMIYLVGVLQNEPYVGSILVAMIEPYWGNNYKSCILPRDEGAAYEPENIFGRKGRISISLTDRMTPEQAVVISFFDEDVITSIRETEIADFKMGPNPSNGKLNLSNLSPGTEVVLYNSEGKCVYSGKQNSTGSIDLSDQSPGVYLMQCKTNDKIKSRKVILK